MARFEIKNGVAIIPDGTTENPLTAFRECQSLRSVTIPESVTTIRDNAFVHCHSLKNVIIQNGVKEIQGGAFSSCISLKSITIPQTFDLLRLTPFHWSPRQREEQKICSSFS